MIDFLGAFFLVMAGGWLAAATAYVQPGARIGVTLRSSLPWAPGLGFGLLSALWFLGIDRSDKAPSGLFIAGSFLVLAGLATLPRRETPPNPGSAEPQSSRRFLHLGLLFVLAIGAWRFSQIVAMRPGGGFDAMAIWNYAARFLHRAGAGYVDLIPQLDPAHHMDYPLLLPASTAALWGLTGEEGRGAQHLIQLSFFLGLPLMLRQLLRGFVGSLRADLAAALLAATPGLLLWCSRQYADAALAYFILASAGGLAARLSKGGAERPPLLLTGFMLAGAVWTKNEGQPLVLLMLACFLIVRLSERSLVLGARECLRLLLGALPLIAPLVFFKLGWAPRNDLIAGIDGRLSEFLLDPSRWSLVAGAFVDQANPLRGESFLEWGVFWPLLGLLAIGGLVGRRLGFQAHERFLLLLSLGSLAGWFLVYVLTPQDQRWHLDTSLSRLLLQIAPMLLFAVLVLFSGPRRSPGSDQRSEPA